MTDQPTGLSFGKSPTRNPNEHAVYNDGVLIGSVARFQMGAGQFGTTWMATTPDRRTSTHFASRSEAAAWLVQQTGS